MDKTILKNSGALVFIGMLVITSVVPFFVGSSTPILDIDETGELTPRYAEGEQLCVEYTEERDVSRLTYTLNGFHDRSVDIDGEKYYELSLEGESNSLNKGYPELPTVTRSIIVPDDKMMEIDVTSEEYVEYDSISIAPSKGSLSRSEHPDPSEVPYEFGDVYERDEWYPQDIARLRDPYIIRDFRGQVVEFYPFQYNPVRDVLRVHTDVHVEVFSVGRDNRNVLSRSGPLETVSRDFARIYERRFLNYQETLENLNYDPVEEEGDMLVITHDDFAHLMYPFLDWKNSRGLPTEMVNLSDIGDTSDDIKEFIEDYYHDTDLTYVLLVGDDDHVPTPTPWDLWSRASDPSYSFIEGEDYYPDIFVGRFSASEEAHVETQVERSIFYEQDLGGEWRKDTMGIASDEGPGYQNLMDYEFIDMLSDRLLDYGYEHADRFYDGGHGELPGDPSSQDVSDGINDGRNLINYAGHGYSDSLYTSGFSTEDMAGLENINELPFFITVACLTGNFIESQEPCFGEKWTRATHDGHPTGGIAAFSSSKLQDWSPPMAALDEMMHLYTETYEDNVKITTGGIAFNGCMFMNDEYDNGWEETGTWHLFGDPSIQFGKSIPEGEPPEVDVTNPTSGDVLDAYDHVDITWESTEGDDPIRRINLYYSTDEGDTWQTIDTDLGDIDSYVWDVPNEHSTDCLVRVRAVDEVGRTGDGINDGTFTIEGVPPGEPQGRDVEQYALIGEAVENKNFVDYYYPWELERVNVEGEASWDEEGYEEGGSIHIRAEQFGEGTTTTEAYWEQEIVPTSSQIKVDGVFRRNIELDDPDCSVDPAVVELLVHDTGSGWETIYSDGDTSEGDTGWLEFGEERYQPIGHVDAVRAHMHIEAEGTDPFILPPQDALGELWIDEISVYVDAYDEKEHNLISWGPSLDDPGEVSHYNIYRSEDQNGPWDTPIDSVEADGSDLYEYVDLEKGEADDVYWWYVVRAVGENGLEEKNEDAVQEPIGEPGPLMPSDPEPEDGAIDVTTEGELSVRVEHDEAETMDVEFYDASDDFIGSESGVESGERASVTWPGLEYETVYDWYAVADDGEQTARSFTWSFPTEAELSDVLPPTDPVPEDGALDVTTEVELSVYVQHMEEENMEVSFYDASDDSLIGFEDGSHGERVEVTWEDLDHEIEYRWYAVADDGENTAISSPWSFTTVDESGLVAPTGLTVEVDLDTGELILDWNDVGAPGYNIYHSEDRYEDFEAWNYLDMTEETSYVHKGALGGENYYVIRATDGVNERARSSMVFCVERNFVPGRTFVSIPMGLGRDGELRASDLVMMIEGDLDSSDYISEVARWDHLIRGYDEVYHHQEGRWSNDFFIEPGDGIVFTVESEFTWHINATDTEHHIFFGDERPRHYTSLPYTLKDHTGDGILRASDIVMMVEGDLDSSDYIFDLVRFDPETGGYEDRFYYDGFSGEWKNDFIIEPGDGIGFGVKGEFTLEIELITPERG